MFCQHAWRTWKWRDLKVRHKHNLTDLDMLDTFHSSSLSACRLGLPGPLMCSQGDKKTMLFQMDDVRRHSQHRCQGYGGLDISFLSKTKWSGRRMKNFKVDKWSCLTTHQLSILIFIRVKRYNFNLKCFKKNILQSVNGMEKKKN